MQCLRHYISAVFSNEESHPNLTETQREILMIWDSLDVEERKVFMTMIRGLEEIRGTVLRKYWTVSFYTKAKQDSDY